LIQIKQDERLYKAYFVETNGITAMNDQVSEILNGIKIFDGVYKKELVDAAIELREEITLFPIK